MKYKYLKEWTKTNPLVNHRIQCHTDDTSHQKGKSSLRRYMVKDFLKWEDQRAITFKSSEDYLHINLNNDNPFPFIANKKHLESFRYEQVSSLHKTLKSCVLINFFISDNDRVIQLVFEKKDIYSQFVYISMFLELIPRKTNLILAKNSMGSKPLEFFKDTSKDQLTIMDSWKVFTYTESNDRAILPHQLYHLPPQDNFVVQKQAINYPLIISDNRILESSLNDVAIKFDNINDAFCALFYESIIINKYKEIKKSKINELKKKKKKLLKKIDNLENELLLYSDSEIYKHKAELIKYNLHNIKKGMTKVNVINYFANPPSDLDIDLKQDKSSLQNMYEYLKKYRKSINGFKIKEQQIVLTKEELEEINKEIFDIENSDLAIDLLTKNHLLDAMHHNIKKDGKKKNINKFRKFRIGNDWEIMIGRTANENDELTCKVAKSHDWWFHARIYQGAHIILRNYSKQSLPDDLLVLSCRLAAWYSKAKHSSNVPIDYTQIRYVTKPHKSPPGFVTYKNHKTKYVNPLSLREAIKYSQQKIKS